MRRKSDGAEGVVLTSANFFYLSIGYKLQGQITFTAKEILRWLNSDFTPIEPRYKTVGEVPSMVVFEIGATETCRGPYYRVGFQDVSGEAVCVNLPDGRYSTFRPRFPVTHILGKLVFVEE